VWWANTGNSRFDEIEHVVSDSFNAPTSVYVTDLDNDGDWDILSTSFMHSGIAWWENDGNGNFFEMHSFDISMRTYVAIPIDIDQDGDLDVIAVGDEIIWWKRE
jgi:hypothetical protein